MKITKPGFYPGFPERHYHADPCPMPSLSSTVSVALIEQSPAHAKAMHPRLTPQDLPEPSTARDMGSAVHSFAFGGAEVVMGEFNDYRSKDARAFREAAYAANQIPLLADAVPLAADMAAAVKPVIASLLGDDYDPECVIAWTEGSTWLRTMIDGLSRDRRTWVNLKTTKGSCDREASLARFYSEAHDMQAGFECRGLDALDPAGKGRRTGYYVNIEQAEPHGISVIQTTEGMMQLGRRRVGLAVQSWRASLDSGKWPSYSIEPIVAPVPDYVTRNWLRRESEDPAIMQIIRDFGGAVK